MVFDLEGRSGLIAPGNHEARLSWFDKEEDDEVR
jgi:hypothetical protein